MEIKECSAHSGVCARVINLEEDVKGMWTEMKSIWNRIDSLRTLMLSILCTAIFSLLGIIGILLTK